MISLRSFFSEERYGDDVSSSKPQDMDEIDEIAKAEDIGSDDDLEESDDEDSLLYESDDENNNQGNLSNSPSRIISSDDDSFANDDVDSIAASKRDIPFQINKWFEQFSTVDKLKTYVENGGDVDTMGKFGSPDSSDYQEVSILHMACLQKKYDVVRFLVQNGADRNIVDHSGQINDNIRNGKTPLMYSIIEMGKTGRSIFDSRSSQCFILLLAGKTIKEIPSIDENDVFEPGAKFIELFRPDKIDIDFQDSMGRTALQYAIQYANFWALVYLLKFGASPSIPWKVPRGQRSKPTITIVQKIIEFSYHTKTIEKLEYYKNILAAVLSYGAEVGGFAVEAPFGEGINKVRGQTMLSTMIIAKSVFFRKADSASDIEKSMLKKNEKEFEETVNDILNDMINEIMYAVSEKDANLSLSDQDKEGLTALHWAASVEDTVTVEKLLKAGATPNIKDNLGRMPEDMTNDEELKNMIEQYYPDNSIDAEADAEADGSAASQSAFDIFSAVILGVASAVRNYAMAVDSVDVLDMSGNTPLFYAAMFDNLRVVRILVGSGANVNFENNLGLSPLYQSIVNNNPEVTAYFLRKGARLSQKTRQLLTALVADNAAFDPTVRAALGIDKQPVQPDSAAKAPVPAPEPEPAPMSVEKSDSAPAPAPAPAKPKKKKAAPRIKYQQAIELVNSDESKWKKFIDDQIEKGSDSINVLNLVFIAASKENKEDVIKYLMVRGISADQKRNPQTVRSTGQKYGGETALSIAIENKNIEIVKMLFAKEIDGKEIPKDKRSKANREYTNGPVPLVQALNEKMFDIVGILLENGANPDKILPGYKSPLEVAIDLGKNQIVDMMMKVRKSSGKLVTDKKLYKAAVDNENPVILGVLYKNNVRLFNPLYAYGPDFMQKMRNIVTKAIDGGSYAKYPKLIKTLEELVNEIDSEMKDYAENNAEKDDDQNKSEQDTMLFTKSGNDDMEV